METLKIHTAINRDGKLKIDVPTSLKEGEVEVILIIESQENKKIKYNFSDLTGRLLWNGDALETQKALRNEW